MSGVTTYSACESATDCKDKITVVSGVATASVCESGTDCKDKIAEEDDHSGATLRLSDASNPDDGSGTYWEDETTFAEDETVTIGTLRTSGDGTPVYEYDWEQEMQFVTDDEESTTGTKKIRSDTIDDVAAYGCGALEAMDVLNRPEQVLQACKEEVAGAAADASSAIHQVVSAFTIRGSELNAVFGEIDGAKKELTNDTIPAKKAGKGSPAKKSGSAKNILVTAKNDSIEISRKSTFDGEAKGDANQFQEAMAFIQASAVMMYVFNLM
jgi:hypothetical protein